jgi:pimeloyl-ACP methyl ester carboxylesterase
MYKIRYITPLIAILVATSILSGCAALEIRRDLSKTFGPYLGNVDNNPVIIIPGIIGSKLVDSQTDRILWGAIKAKQIIFLSERTDIALPTDRFPLSENRDNIVSKGIVDKYELPIGILQLKVYRDMLDMFEEVGYKLGDMKNPKPGDNLFIFDYDWRRDNVESAQLLADRIDNIVKKTGNKKKFTLVSHSMGALIARYYLRYGREDVLEKGPNYRVRWVGSKHIKRAIHIAVPSLGSMPVFRILHKGLDLTVVDYPPYILYTMPSIYQLLPHKQLKSFVDVGGNEIYIDIYDIESWKKYGWSIFSEKMTRLVRSRMRLKYRDDWEERLRAFEQKRDSFVQAALDRADLFQKSLSHKPRNAAPFEVILFGGDTEWTVDKAIVKKEVTGRWRTYFWDPRLKEKILKPGDTMVTRESLLGVSRAGTTMRSWKNSPMDISFSLFVAARHENIHKDLTFKNNLLHILLVE